MYKRQLVGKALDVRSLDVGAFKSTLRAAIGRHPADYFFPLAGAMMAERAGENSIPWIQRALKRGPYVGRTHLVLADILSRRGVQNQALLELKLAATYEPNLVGDSAIIAVRTTRVGDQLLRAVPDGADGLPMLDALASTLDVATSLAAREAVSILAKRTHATGGLILLDRKGNPGFAFNTPRMAYGYLADGDFIIGV